jgi:hypothetical protein
MANTNHDAQPCPGTRHEVVLPDRGGWLSGPCRDVPEDRPQRSLSTREKTALALSVPCEVHQVPAGTACPRVALEACMARRGAALGDG